MDTEQQISAKVRSARGRPPKLTAAMIVAKTRELLGEMQPEDISFARVARELGVPSSSVYNYFPNREALLGAVAANVFADFHFADPGSGAPWQQRLRAWLDEIDHFFDRNPVAFRVMATNSQASSAWVSARAPLLKVLHGLGFEERQLTLVHSWFEGQVTGLLLVEYYASRNRALVAEIEGDASAPMSDAERCEFERRHYLPEIRREEIVKLSFDALVAALERMTGGGPAS